MPSNWYSASACLPCCLLCFVRGAAAFSALSGVPELMGHLHGFDTGLGVGFSLPFLVRWGRRNWWDIYMSLMWGWGLGFSIHDVCADGKQAAISGPWGCQIWWDAYVGSTRDWRQWLRFSIYSMHVDGEQAILLALLECWDWWDIHAALGVGGLDSPFMVCMQMESIPPSLLHQRCQNWWDAYGESTQGWSGKLGCSIHDLHRGEAGLSRG